MSRRVMILAADYPPRVWSGIGTAVERQARALAARGFEVCVLVPGEAPPAGGGGPRVLSLAGPRLPVDPRRFDVVHLHSLALSELAVEIVRRHGPRLVYTAHSLLHRELESGPEADLWCAVQGRVLARSWRVVFPSEAEREEAVALLPELRDRSRVVPNAVPAPPRTLPEPGAGAPLVFAGRFARSKGLELLAEAVPRLLERRPMPVVLAGGHGDGDGEAAVQRLLDACPGCRVAGWLGRAELDALFASAALVLAPSLYEPFGLVALEAMRMGAPVLAADTGGLREVVGPGSGGRLVASRDPEAWVCAALAILEDPQERLRLRRRGPRHVAARFTPERAAARLEEVYAA